MEPSTLTILHFFFIFQNKINAQKHLNTKREQQKRFYFEPSWDIILKALKYSKIQKNDFVLEYNL